MERLDKLETAVYEAGGADEEVLDELEDGENTDLTGALTQSSVFKTLQVCSPRMHKEASGAD